MRTPSVRLNNRQGISTDLQMTSGSTVLSIFLLTFRWDHFQRVGNQWYFWESRTSSSEVYSTVSASLCTASANPESKEEKTCVRLAWPPSASWWYVPSLELLMWTFPSTFSIFAVVEVEYRRPSSRVSRKQSEGKNLTPREEHLFIFVQLAARLVSVFNKLTWTPLPFDITEIYGK